MSTLPALQGSSKRFLFFISGASKGLGRAIALALATDKAITTFLLTARSLDGLEQTKAKIQSAHPNAKVRILIQDLGQPDKEAFERFVLEEGREDVFDEAVFIHNAGSLGNHGKPFDQVKKKLNWEIIFFDQYFIFSLYILFLN